MKQQKTTELNSTELSFFYDRFKELLNDTKGKRTMTATINAFCSEYRISSSTVRRWLGRKLSDVRKSSIKDVAKAFKVSFEYLIGETERKTEREYLIELQAKNNNAENERLKAYQDEYRVRSGFFKTMCGYEYSDSPAVSTAAHDFYHIGKVPSGYIDRPYSLTKEDGTKICFSEREFKLLTQNIKSMVDFECYKQAQKVSENNGADSEKDE